jgi:hypothetical protein
MSVTLPKPDLSWLGQLSGAIAPQQQQAGQMTANGYFPPAPAAGQPQQSGGFLSQLMNKLPQNQFSVNPMMNTNFRLGG